MAEQSPTEHSPTNEPEEQEAQDEQSTPSPVEFSSGDRVRLAMRPPYFKTADPMPMLRPPDIIPVGEHGTVVERRPAGYWAVRFEQGIFLMDDQYIQPVSD